MSNDTEQQELLDLWHKDECLALLSQQLTQYQSRKVVLNELLSDLCSLLKSKQKESSIKQHISSYACELCSPDYYIKYIITELAHIKDKLPPNKHSKFTEVINSLKKQVNSQNQDNWQAFFQINIVDLPRKYRRILNQLVKLPELIPCNKLSQSQEADEASYLSAYDPYRLIVSECNIIHGKRYRRNEKRQIAYKLDALNYFVESQLTQKSLENIANQCVKSVAAPELKQFAEYKIVLRLYIALTKKALYSWKRTRQRIAEIQAKIQKQIDQSDAINIHDLLSECEQSRSRAIRRCVKDFKMHIDLSGAESTALNENQNDIGTPYNQLIQWSIRHLSNSQNTPRENLKAKYPDEKTLKEANLTTCNGISACIKKYIDEDESVVKQINLLNKKIPDSKIQYEETLKDIKSQLSGRISPNTITEITHQWPTKLHALNKSADSSSTPQEEQTLLITYGIVADDRIPVGSESVVFLYTRILKPLLHNLVSTNSEKKDAPIQKVFACIRLCIDSTSKDLTVKIPDDLNALKAMLIELDNAVALIEGISHSISCLLENYIKLVNNRQIQLHGEHLDLNDVMFKLRNVALSFKLCAEANYLFWNEAAFSDFCKTTQEDFSSFSNSKFSENKNALSLCLTIVLNIVKAIQKQNALPDQHPIFNLLNQIMSLFQKKDSFIILLPKTRKRMIDGEEMLWNREDRPSIDQKEFKALSQTIKRQSQLSEYIENALAPLSVIIFDYFKSQKSIVLDQNTFDTNNDSVSRYKNFFLNPEKDSLLSFLKDTATQYSNLATKLDVSPNVLAVVCFLLNIEKHTASMHYSPILLLGFLLKISNILKSFLSGLGRLIDLSGWIDDYYKIVQNTLSHFFRYLVEKDDRHGLPQFFYWVMRRNHLQKIDFFNNVTELERLYLQCFGLSEKPIIMFSGLAGIAAIVDSQNKYKINFCFGAYLLQQSIKASTRQQFACILAQKIMPRFYQKFLTKNSESFTEARDAFLIAQEYLTKTRILFSAPIIDLIRKNKLCVIFDFFYRYLPEKKPDFSMEPWKETGELTFDQLKEYYKNSGILNILNQYVVSELKLKNLETSALQVLTMSWAYQFEFYIIAEKNDIVRGHKLRQFKAFLNDAKDFFQRNNLGSFAEKIEASIRHLEEFLNKNNKLFRVSSAQPALFGAFLIKGIQHGGSTPEATGARGPSGTSYLNA